MAWVYGLNWLEALIGYVQEAIKVVVDIIAAGLISRAFLASQVLANSS
ncbi:hypothetical protein MIZ03_0295 [Rhodoferax lithotrophicus]|uniref:Uncharacterized protein n=1 Tax=Rhodoferax lithotrophicus TaxID=2798804 RepID=A0ABM7U9Q6_9BURK|nr:hypothetical protein MIZ03_0295 [Rhodoferax sp. MIZ03]